MYKSLRRLIKRKLIVLLVVSAFSISSKAQSLDTNKLHTFLSRLTEKNKAMGSLLLSKDGKVLFSRAIGYTNINSAEKAPLSIASRYRIGSVTKMFTATMIFQLIEDGKLTLQTTLDKFFPQVPQASQITIEQVLAHRSGIHELTENREFRGRRFDEISKNEMVTLIAKSPLDFEPGTKYSYSSSGYFLLGCILEKLEGQSYEDVLKKRISGKIGLENTYPGTGKIDWKKGEVHSYRFTHDWEEQPQTNMSILFGSGSMISTVADQAKFIQALFEGKLISQQSLNNMKQNRLGIDTFTYNSKTFFGHTGGIDGFGSWLMYQPENKFLLSYAANGKVYPVAKMVDDIISILSNTSYQVPDFNSFNVSTVTLDKYVGVYTREGAPVQFTITRDGDKLYAAVTGQSAIQLEATAENLFKIESIATVIEFDVEKQTMTVKRNGGERVFKKTIE